jgi:hypothetical protein
VKDKKLLSFKMDKGIQKQFERNEKLEQCWIDVAHEMSKQMLDKTMDPSFSDYLKNLKEDRGDGK